MNIELRPKFARVLIRRERMKSKVGGIYIPDDVAKRNAPSKGVVVAKGPEADDSIEVGSTVIFGQYAGAWLNADGTVMAESEEAEFFVCQDEDVIAEVAA